MVAIGDDLCWALGPFVLYTTELRIPVMQHVTALAEPSRRVVDGVARHLSHPGFGGMACDAGKSDAPALQIQEEKT